MKAWKNAEKRIAELLGGKRLIRSNFNERKPDATGEKAGFKFIIESKHGKHIPVFVTKTLEQSQMYAKKGSICIAYFHPKGRKCGLVMLDANQFVEILESKIVDESQGSLFK